MGVEKGRNLVRVDVARPICGQAVNRQPIGFGKAGPHQAELAVAADADFVAG